MKKFFKKPTKDGNEFISMLLSPAEMEAIKGGDDTTETIIIVDIVND